MIHQMSGNSGQETEKSGRFAPWKEAKPPLPDILAPALAGGNFFCSLFTDI
jgi:hypothetical protein